MITLKADNKRRVALPNIQPGQVFAYEASGQVVTLTPIQKAEPRRVQAKLVRKGGRLIFEVPEGLELAEKAIPRTVPK
jgi:hypothetical protein